MMAQYSNSPVALTSKIASGEEEIMNGKGVRGLMMLRDNLERPLNASAETRREASVMHFSTRANLVDNIFGWRN
jgi:hypothetical protein